MEKQNLQQPFNETQERVLSKTEKARNPESLPACHFELIDTNKEAELFFSFIATKKDRFSGMFNKAYPELQAIQDSSKNDEDLFQKIKEFVETLRATNEGKMLAAQDKLEIEWSAIGPAFLTELADHFETAWPDNKPEIIGEISNLPVFPRFLDDYRFCVGYKDTARSIETTAHEIVHFLWFKKWKEVFPETTEESYESPHLVWRLSEIIDPIILQCNPTIKELIKPQKWGYTSFENIKIGDVGMTDFFKKIYLDSVIAGDGFDVTTKKLWEAAQAHEAEISTF